MKMLNWVSGLKVTAWLSSIIFVLLGLLKYSKHKNSSLKKEAKEVADAIVQSEHNHSIDVKNAINKEAYRKEKDKIDEASIDLSKPYTT